MQVGSGVVLLVSILTIIFGILVITLPLSVYLVQRNTYKMLNELKSVRGELEALNQKTHHLLEGADRMEMLQAGPQE
ncbi:hypothetical protein ACGF5M_03680 [Gemmatimonadota bacterium]